MKDEDQLKRIGTKPLPLQVDASHGHLHIQGGLAAAGSPEDASAAEVICQSGRSDDPPSHPTQ